MKTHAIKFLLSVLLFGCSVPQTYAQAYGEIRGIIKNTELEVVPFATVKILQGTQLVGGAETNEDGKYSIKPLSPGTYEMVILHPEYITKRINKISVSPSEATYVDTKLSANTLGTVVVLADPIDYTNTGVDVDMFHTISISGSDLTQNASYTRGNVKNVLEFMSSEVVVTGGEIHVRGARGDATGYFVDGVRTMEPGTIPGLAIENISAFTGGIPAMYGDLSSGALLISTKSYFSGLRDKNLRNAERVEKATEERAEKKAKEAEASRAKEIEQEKQKERE
ncbi:MAG: carboxypeptidase regulatory-like domain-containing protein [bacterium]|nr:carboxypeptidase regulatory-like domain-containing protein [bacterium]